MSEVCSFLGSLQPSTALPSMAEIHTPNSQIILWLSFALSLLVPQQQPWGMRPRGPGSMGGQQGQDRCSSQSREGSHLGLRTLLPLETQPEHKNTLIPFLKLFLFLKLLSGGKHFALLRSFFSPRPPFITAHKGCHRLFVIWQVLPNFLSTWAHLLPLPLPFSKK